MILLFEKVQKFGRWYKNEEIREALADTNYVIEYIKTCKDNYIRNAEGVQSTGEYSIECVIKKSSF